jgi:hypothetical protein
MPPPFMLGLDTLSRRGTIELRIRKSRQPERALTAEPAVVLLRVRNSTTQRPMLLAIDLRDQSDFFASGVLDRCETCFKRSFHRPDVIGLPPALACKAREYLAASQCIVAEPPRNELPVSLVAGRHFLPFRNADECVSACRRVLEDESLALEMRKANHEYYRSEVEPSSHTWQILERTMCLSETNEAPANARVE